MLSSLFQPKLLFVRFLNSLLSQEPWALERARQQKDKTVRFQLPITSMSLSFQADGTVALADASAPANVTVTLSSEQVPQLLNELTKGGGFAEGFNVQPLMSALHIEGEAALANLVSDLARDLRWDRQTYLANLIGPILTSHLLRTEQVVLAKGREGASTALKAGADILAHEQSVLIAKVHFNDLNRELTRLDERLTKLEQTLAKPGQ